MMKMVKSVSFFIILLLAAFNLCMISYAEDYQNLTIICRKENTIISGMEWKIYYIAEINAKGDYIIKNEFSNYPLSFDKNSVSSLQKAAGMYETYTIKDNIVPFNQGETDSEGKLVFSNLNAGFYLITGEPVSIDGLAFIPVPSLVHLNTDDKGETAWTYDLTSLPKLKVLPASDFLKSDYNVSKEWLDDNEGVRPKYVTAVLYRNDVEFDSIVLNEENDWKYTWNNLPQTAEWSILEGDVPEGYSVSYFESEDTVTITNKFSSTSTETSSDNNSNSTETNNSDSNSNSGSSSKLPQTGMMLWPVPVLAISGIIVFVIGWFLYKRGGNEK